MARIEDRVLKSGATVSIHTRLTLGEGMAIAKRRREIGKIKDLQKQAFEMLRLFVTGWTLKNLDTHELLPFTAEGLADADLVEFNEISELIEKVELGQFPNDSSEKSLGTKVAASRKNPSATKRSQPKS